MARPVKGGLDYFPLDVNFLQDLKVRKIMRAHGPVSVAVLLCLLGSIYRENGYYMKWDEDVSFLVADEVGTSEGSVIEIVTKAIQVGFFDKGMFEEEQILTSSGIQSRYLKAIERRVNVDINPNYCLINVDRNSVNVDINSINAYRSTQRKGKESKGKKSKGEERKGNAPAPAINTNLDYSSVFEFQQTHFGMIGQIDAQDLMDFCETIRPELVKRAMQMAVDKGKPLSFAKGIMRNYANSKIKTVEQAEGYDAQFGRKSSSPSKAVSAKHVDAPERLVTGIEIDREALLKGAMRNG